MNKSKLWSVALVALPATTLLMGSAASPEPQPTTITVRNPLPLLRRVETISLPLAKLPAAARQFAPANLRVKDETGTVLVSQLIDSNADGQPEELLFQTDMPAKASKKFTLIGMPAGTAAPASPHTTFSRFVPERTDDYAWENERVAFRTYGPVAEQLAVAKDPNGTLTSGMDCWLKRVDYPIIDKWYGRHVHEKPFAYHTDTGEGYDPYHVGGSRGTGGTGVLDKGKLYVSRNFTSYKTLATGPIRTIFELTYAPWDAAGHQVTEKKIISLDLGSNLTRYEEHIRSTPALPNCTIGLTLHAQNGVVKGEVKADPKAGWFRYWEKIDDSYLGTAVVAAPRYIIDYHDHRTPEKDQTQLYVVTKPQQDVVVFYAGFGWQKNGQFASAQAWDTYLAEFAQRLAVPLQVHWK